MMQVPNPTSLVQQVQVLHHESLAVVRGVRDQDLGKVTVLKVERRKIEIVDPEVAPVQIDRDRMRNHANRRIALAVALLLRTGQEVTQMDREKVGLLL